MLVVRDRGKTIDGVIISDEIPRVMAMAKRVEDEQRSQLTNF